MYLLKIKNEHNEQKHYLPQYKTPYMCDDEI